MNRILRVLPVVLLQASATLSAQSPTPTPAPTLNYSQALAAFNTLPSNATASQKWAAMKLVAAAPDATPDQHEDALLDISDSHCYGVGSLADCGDADLASYQFGADLNSFLQFLDNRLFDGGGDPVAAKAMVPAFVAAHPGWWASAANAIVADSNSDSTAAYPAWFDVASYAPTSVFWYNQGLLRVAQIAKTQGLTPQQLNAVLIPLMTSRDVFNVGAGYHEAYNDVNRSPLVMTQPNEALNFMNAVLFVVKVNKSSTKFLGDVVSQKKAITQ